MRLERDARGACQDRQEVRGRVLEVVDLARHQRRLRGLRVRHPDELDAVDLHHLAAGMAGRRLAARHVAFELGVDRSEEHTSELQSLMRISYAVFCLKKKQREGRIE